jgi:hypothetical protein
MPSSFIRRRWGSPRSVTNAADLTIDHGVADPNRLDLGWAGRRRADQRAGVGMHPKEPLDRIGAGWRGIRVAAISP